VQFLVKEQYCQNIQPVVDSIHELLIEALSRQEADLYPAEKMTINWRQVRL